MRTEMNEEEGAIILFVAVPDCSECRSRITDILTNMKCWKDIQIGYPSEYGTAIKLFYDKNDKDTDFWWLAERAKEILQSHCYRVI